MIPIFSPQIINLASSIQEYGFRWVEDGPTLAEIIRLVDVSATAELKKRNLGADQLLTLRRKICEEALDLLDMVYGWDADRMSETEERMFYRALVGFTVK